RVAGRELSPAHASVRIEKHGPGLAFASGTWIYASQKPAPARAGDVLQVERRFFKKTRKADGDHLVPLAPGAHVKVGDAVEVRLLSRSKSPLEYVHVKEPRGAGFEETTLRSGYVWEKLIFYQEPRDSLLNFFVDWMPQGEFELRHSLRPTTPGHYRIASAV